MDCFRCSCDTLTSSVWLLVPLSAVTRLVYALPIEEGRFALLSIHLKASDPILSVSRSLASEVFNF